ncbi:hypothetical protein [Micromonospora rubida]|uniref:hypothetical protein n=1 Tax=Micromonospora rubida TaxID=2697657 RepID=UPI0013772B37|nr:hypothetical protein [Micromonospora rubida]NBE80342.1 hypothetical protein [Micromonospora rubida]
MSTAVDTTQQLATVPAPTAGPAPAGAGHRPCPAGTRDAAGRRQIADPVPASYLLSPAAQQLTTRTTDPVHAGPADATGLLRVRDIPHTGAWTTPPAAGPAADWFATDTRTEQP